MTGFMNAMGLVIVAGMAACSAASQPETEARIGLPYYGSAEFTPHWFDSTEDVPEGFHTIPSFAFRDQRGQSVTERAFEGKVYVADFFFTTCRGICQDMTENLRKVQDVFIDDPRVLIVSHTVTPDVDTVDVLARYGARFGVQPDKWHLLTGDEAETYRLGRQAYFVDEDQGRGREDEFLHSENFVLIDEGGHIRGIYNGLNDTAVSQLIADIRTLRGPSRN